MNKLVKTSKNLLGYSSIILVVSMTPIAYDFGGRGFTQGDGGGIVGIVLFLRVAKNSLDKRLRILFFFRALCLIRTWQTTEPENSQYI